VSRRAAARDRLAFAVAVVGNAVLLYWPRPVATGGGVPHLDKVAHLVIFAAVAWTGRRLRLPVVPLVVVLVVHAVVSELVQELLLPRRSGDLADLVADLAGVLAGLLVAAASWRDERAAPAAPRD
jgi:hypothetical protein